MNDGPGDDMETRLAAEQALLDQRVQSAAGLARAAGEWFDIYASIVRGGVSQTILRSGGTDDDTNLKMKAYLPAMSKVRREMEARGLSLNEELDVEGPETRHDELGIPSIVTWPRGVWIEIFEKGSKQAPLRFEGQAALVAHTFLLWWVGFQQVHLAREGRLQQKSRIVDPTSAEYLDYIEAKRKDLGG